MKYAATVHAKVSASLADVFNTIAPIDLTTIFMGYVFLPAVVGVRDYPGRWDAPGLSRTIVFSDGSSAHETLVRCAPYTGFAYEVTDFGGIAGRFVDAARGQWHFSELPGGLVSITWTYAFVPRPRRGGGVRFILPFWKRYMQKALRLSCAAVPPRAAVRP